MQKDVIIKIETEAILSIVFSKTKEIIPYELDELIEKIEGETDNISISGTRDMDRILGEYCLIFKQNYYKDKGWRYARSTQFNSEESKKKRVEFLEEIPKNIYQDIEGSINEFLKACDYI